jgi:hypothetical protein
MTNLVKWAAQSRKAWICGLGVAGAVALAIAGKIQVSECAAVAGALIAVLIHAVGAEDAGDKAAGTQPLPPSKGPQGGSATLELLGALVLVVSLGLLAVGCSDDPAGAGATCTGPAAQCQQVLADLGRIGSARHAEGLVDVSSITDLVLVAGAEFQRTDVLDGPGLCGLNRELLDPRKLSGFDPRSMLRCFNFLASDPALCPDGVLGDEVHEQEHCGLLWQTWDADSQHTDCASWGPQPSSVDAQGHPAPRCVGSPPGALQRVLEAVQASPPMPRTAPGVPWVCTGPRARCSAVLARLRADAPRLRAHGVQLGGVL